MHALYSLLLVVGSAHLVAGAACKLNAAGCCDFGGEWCNHENSDGIMYKWIQTGCNVDTNVPRIPGMLREACANGTVVGDTMSMTCRGHGSPPPMSYRTATLTINTMPVQDVLQWNYPGPNGKSRWYRGGNNGNYSCRTNKTSPTP